MKVFNLAEELEKERKKNKELKEENTQLRIQISAREEIIDKAIEYIEKQIPCIHDEEILDKLLNILKGE